MFRWLGTVVSRAWPVFLAGWVVLVAVLWFVAPPWDRVGKSGQFAYLPADAPTRRAEAEFDESFPGQRVGSTIVLVAVRPDGPLTDADLAFVNTVFAPRLRQALAAGGWADRPDALVARYRTPGDGPTGALLVSQDRRAALVVAELTTEFLDAQNWPVVAAVEDLIGSLKREGAVPAGLDLALTGSAVLGRDQGRAELDSARAVERWTILVVVALLLAVYRAPLLAALPLITVAVAVEVALRLLGLLAEAGQLNLFQGVRTYLTVVGYGAGVDYCLFLIARCREEWAAGPGDRAAVGRAVGRVGAAVTASAATVVAGIAMMGFADFGKLRQAGLGIAFGLAVVLAAALTFAPALLCLTGRWAVWPWHRAVTADPGGQHFWAWLGGVLTRWPAAVWAACVAVMAPFAVYAAVRHDATSYDLTRNLPPGAASAGGLDAVRTHFPAGWTGPVTVLLRDDRADFRTPDGIARVGEFAKRLEARRDELGLADVRSVAEPLGTTPAARKALGGLGFGASAARSQAVEHYVGAAGHVTRLDLVPDWDPFSEAGLDNLNRLEAAVRAELPEGADAAFAGAGPSMQDLKTVTRRDQWRVQGLVVVAVLAVLLALLRRPGLSLYLIATVVFSYLTTFGVTLLAFGESGPGGFVGPDWKVPLFLFTILVAVGEDYNIFLVSRVREEEKKHGPVGGVTAALTKTGGVITSCGLIMAGTFASLLAGSLAELKQMGFALACGVLLDTLVVRPVLVPAFLLFLRTRPERSAAVTRP